MPTQDARVDDVPGPRSHRAIGPVNSLCDKEITVAPFWDPPFQSANGDMRTLRPRTQLLVGTQDPIDIHRSPGGVYDAGRVHAGELSDVERHRVDQQ
jgi:hypothetical protein